MLAICGDADKTTNMFMPGNGRHKYAVDLVKQIAGLNRGVYIDEDLQEKTATNFCVGVAGYPEKHNEAPDSCRYKTSFTNESS